ncbi:MAG: PilZ domain-containing protein [Deltaproteobacteria bacterium]|nr:MAG: PilZ domain-containing protein [Deltaproteobacteria bacterium]
MNGVTTTYGINRCWSTMQQSVERRSESRLPIVVPVEYLRPDDSAILSYALDLSKNGTFISSDDPLSTGSRFGMQLTIPVDDESSKVFRTEATVTWNKIQPFKSKGNGMGVRFVEPLPEDLLLHASAHSYRKLIKETEAKKLLEDRVERLESELEDAERLGALGRYVEKILFEVSNPILTLSGKLETIKVKMRKHKTMLEGHWEANKGEFKGITEEFDNCCREVDQILKDYKTISELAYTVGDDRETLERKLKKRYRC